MRISFLNAMIECFDFFDAIKMGTTGFTFLRQKQERSKLLQKKTALNY